MLWILCPFNSADEVGALIEAGADELYCGVLSPEWRSRYSSLASPNKRDDPVASLPDFAALERAVTAAHAHGVPVHVALNTLYSEGHFPLLRDELRRIVDAGVDALIVADLGLLLTLRDAGLGVRVHVSTIGVTFNGDTIAAYRELGASRVILPRQLRMDEIARLAERDHGVELEVFARNEACRNVDGFCTFLHVGEELARPAPSAHAPSTREAPAMTFRPCGVRSRVRPHPARADTPEEVVARVSAAVNDASCGDPCGACRLADFDRLGIRGVKIVGRQRSTGKKTRDVGFLAAVRGMIGEAGVGEPERVARIKELYRRHYGAPCGDTCYYPD